MFGGKLEANGGNVTDELWVFNIPGRTWQRKIPVVGPPGQTQIYAVEGHSAHCVLLEGGEAIMLVIFGYSPIYSYISNVQEYNLSKSRLRSSASWHFFFHPFQPTKCCCFSISKKTMVFFSIQDPTLGWYQRPEAPFPKEVMATAARMTPLLAACMSMAATRLCLPTSTA